MKILRIAILAIVAILSLAAGLAKVMRVPQEAVFFEGLGLSLGLMTAIGALQLVGALCVIFPKSQKLGAILAATAFLTSAIMIFMNGQIAFGLFSLLPAALAGSVLFFRSVK